jgi:hypothetical protein
MVLNIEACYFMSFVRIIADIHSSNTSILFILIDNFVISSKRQSSTTAKLHTIKLFKHVLRESGEKGGTKK